MTFSRDKEPPYGGGGAGGKFQKRRFRTTIYTTPYDRPPPPLASEFRNPNGGGGGGGWLSKLVDPAQRLIASGAHRFFSTVFRKRLPAPSQPPLSPQERDLKATNQQQEAVSTVSHGAQKEIVDQIGGPSNANGQLNELEHILQKKTFTRSEIDHLTALLHSRTIDPETEEQEKTPEVNSLKPTSSTYRQAGFPRAAAEGNKISDGFPKTPLLGNRAENQLVSTPVVNSTVLEGDGASPTELIELAKSYMHKRPVSPSMLGFRSQSVVENSTAIYSRNLNSPSRLPFTPLVPKSTSGHADARQNGFITPRSRGRSAIYNMARTPYSRVHPTVTSKGVENAVDVYGGNSASQYAQGGLKRRSSVLDNDIGSFGAIRRTRQKPNLLSSRGLSLTVSGSMVSSYRSHLGSEAVQDPSSSKLKQPVSRGEAGINSTNDIAENGDISVLNTTVPSKSSEMASKILQQLDKLVSPKEKSSEAKVLALMDKSSPSMLSPSMLRGQALKSLEHVDSSKFVRDAQRDKILDGSPSKEIFNAQASTSQEQGKVTENGPVKFGSTDYKFSTKMNGTTDPTRNGEVSRILKKDVFPTFSAASNTAAYPPQKKQAFQMSALEDFVDLDEDSLVNGTVSDSEGKGKSNFSLPESKSIAGESLKMEKGSALAEDKPVTSELNQKTEIGNSTGAVAAEKSSSLIFQNRTSPSVTVVPTSVINTESSLTFDRGSLVKDSNVSPPTFNFECKIPSARDISTAPSAFGFGLNSSDKVLPPQETDAASYPTPEASSNLSTLAANSAFSSPKLPEPEKAGDKSNTNPRVSLKTPESVLPAGVSTSSSSTFSFSTSPTNVSLKNGSLTSKSSTPAVFSNFTSQNSSGGGNISSSSQIATFSLASSSSTLSASNPAPSLPNIPAFKFGSSVPTVAVPSAPETSTTSTPVASFFTTKQATAAAPVSEPSPAVATPVFKLSSSPASIAPAAEASSAATASVFKFMSPVPSTTNEPVSKTSDVSSEGVKTKQDAGFGNLSTAPATTANTASSLFGFTAGTDPSTANQSQGSLFGATTVSAPSALASSAGTGAFAHSIPVKFGSSAPSPTFGLAGSTTSTSSTSLFGSVQDAKPFGSEPAPGFGSSSSEANSVSTNSSSTSSVFGSTWQAPKSPVFSFNSSPSTGFSFGGSTAPSVATNNSPSTGFSFTASSAPSANTGSQSTGFSFGASSASNAATSSLPSTGFSFNASSASTAATNSSPSPFGTTASASTNGTPMPFGSSNGAASSSSLFSFNSSSATASTQPVFGNPSPAFGFGANQGNNDQMSMEDSMAEDTVQASVPAAPIFGQQPSAQPSPSFTFGSAAPALGNLFQFGSQPNLSNPQNPSPFQASGSLGSNFSMGSGGSGVDKSSRKYVKVKHKQRKK